MAAPFGMHPMGFPWGNMYAVPAIPPSSSPLVINPEAAIRDFAEHATGGGTREMATVNDLKWLEEWGKIEDYRKIILEVVKARLDLAWPYNYKALDVLAVMPTTVLPGFKDQLTKIADLPGSTLGAVELKKAVKPLLEKAKEEQGKLDEADFKAKQAAIAEMWGGLWANQPGQGVAYNYPMGTPGFYNPYLQWQPPRVAQAAAAAWAGKPPEGWQPASITAVPQIYPFSRTGYLALLPEGKDPPPEPPKPKPWWMTLNPAPPG